MAGEKDGGREPKGPSLIGSHIKTKLGSCLLDLAEAAHNDPTGPHTSHGSERFTAAPAESPAAPNGHLAPPDGPVADRQGRGVHDNDDDVVQESGKHAPCNNDTTGAPHPQDEGANALVAKEGDDGKATSMEVEEAGAEEAGAEEEADAQLGAEEEPAVAVGKERLSDATRGQPQKRPANASPQGSPRRVVRDRAKLKTSGSPRRACAFSAATSVVGAEGVDANDGGERGQGHDDTAAADKDRHDGADEVAGLGEEGGAGVRLDVAVTGSKDGGAVHRQGEMADGDGRGGGDEGDEGEENKAINTMAVQNNMVVAEGGNRNGVGGTDSVVQGPLGPVPFFERYIEAREIRKYIQLDEAINGWRHDYQPLRPEDVSVEYEAKINNDAAHMGTAQKGSSELGVKNSNDTGHELHAEMHAANNHGTGIAQKGPSGPSAYESLSGMGIAQKGSPELGVKSTLEHGASTTHVTPAKATAKKSSNIITPEDSGAGGNVGKTSRAKAAQLVADARMKAVLVEEKAKRIHVVRSGLTININVLSKRGEATVRKAKVWRKDQRENLGIAIATSMASIVSRTGALGKNFIAYQKKHSTTKTRDEAIDDLVQNVFPAELRRLGWEVLTGPDEGLANERFCIELTGVAAITIHIQSKEKESPKTHMGFRWKSGSKSNSNMVYVFFPPSAVDVLGPMLKTLFADFRAKSNATTLAEAREELETPYLPAALQELGMEEYSVEEIETRNKSGGVRPVVGINLNGRNSFFFQDANGTWMSQHDHLKLATRLLNGEPVSSPQLAGRIVWDEGRILLQSSQPAAGKSTLPTVDESTLVLSHQPYQKIETRTCSCPCPFDCGKYVQAKNTLTMHLMNTECAVKLLDVETENGIRTICDPLDLDGKRRFLNFPLSGNMPPEFRLALHLRGTEEGAAIEEKVTGVRARARLSVAKRLAAMDEEFHASRRAANRERMRRKKEEELLATAKLLDSMEQDSRLFRVTEEGAREKAFNDAVRVAQQILESEVFEGVYAFDCTLDSKGRIKNNEFVAFLIGIRNNLLLKKDENGVGVRLELSDFGLANTGRLLEYEIVHLRPTRGGSASLLFERAYINGLAEVLPIGQMLNQGYYGGDTDPDGDNMCGAAMIRLLNLGERLKEESVGYSTNAMNSTKKAIEESIPDEFQTWLDPSEEIVAGLKENQEKTDARRAARKEKAMKELDLSE